MAIIGRMINKTKKIIATIIVFLLMIQNLPLGLWPGQRQPELVEAASYTITKRIDFDTGYYNNVESKSKEGKIKLSPDGVWGPRAWRTPNVPLGDQAAITSDGNYIYLLANADNYFARYLPSENRWQRLADAPHFAHPGAGLVVLGNYIYAIFGGYQREFSRYSIIDNIWEELTLAPDLIYGGSALASVPGILYDDHTVTIKNDEIFVTRDYNTNSFYKYDITPFEYYQLQIQQKKLLPMYPTLTTDGNRSFFVIRYLMLNIPVMIN